jgi:hypothetical protein
MQNRARLLRETMRGVLDLGRVDAAKTSVDLVCMGYGRCYVHLVSPKLCYWSSSCAAVNESINSGKVTAVRAVTSDLRLWPLVAVQLR